MEYKYREKSIECVFIIFTLMGNTFILDNNTIILLIIFVFFVYKYQLFIFVNINY